MGCLCGIQGLIALQPRILCWLGRNVHAAAHIVTPGAAEGAATSDQVPGGGRETAARWVCMQVPPVAQSHKMHQSIQFITSSLGWLMSCMYPMQS